MAPSPGWDAETLWQQLVPVWPRLSVEVVPELASTNTTLLQRSGDPAPCLLVAEHQTQGRGRMGRAWYSAPGASLTFSLAVPLEPQQWEGLSLVVGLALAQALEPAQDPSARQRLMLKWPNDLWLLNGSGDDAVDWPSAVKPALSSSAPSLGRKLGGVLIETTSRGGQRWAVVGVGLNIVTPVRNAQHPVPGVEPLPAAAPTEPTTTAFSPRLDHGYAALQELYPDCSAPQTLARVALPLAQALRSFEAAGFAPWVTAFAQRDMLRGRAVVTHGTPPLSGLACGVDSTGALLVQAGGTKHRVHSGEVSVRLLATAEGL